MSKNIFRCRFRDGHTYAGYIAAEPRLHDELRFSFRYFQPEEVEALEDAATKRGAKGSVQLLAAAMADGKLVDWSEIDEKGEPAKVTQENLRNIPTKLFNKLYRILAGRDPWDPDPLKQLDDAEDAYVRGLQAMIDGKQPGPAALEDAAKN